MRRFQGVLSVYCTDAVGRSASRPTIIFTLLFMDFHSILVVSPLYCRRIHSLTSPDERVTYIVSTSDRRKFGRGFMANNWD